MIQKTCWSKTSRVVTVLTVLLMAGVAAVTYFLDAETAWVSIFILALTVVLCVSAMCYMPVEVMVDDASLTVRCPLRRKVFPLKEIASAAPFVATRKIWRVCGSGAFFGWWGWFTAKGEGRFFMYASTLDHLVLLTLVNGRKYVISCADPQTLADSINARTGK